MNALSDAIARLSPEQRAILELRLKRKLGAAPRADAISRRPEPGPAPLSFAQERLWFLDQLEPGSPLYNISAGLRLEGALEAGALERSFVEVARRHEILRTTFTWRGNEPVQVVAPEPRVPFRTLDLSDLPVEERELQALALATVEARQPFDLHAGPLVRLLLLRLAERDHLLVVSLHHIVADGGSVEVLLRETGALLTAFQAGRPSPLPELPVQYGDYAAWLRQWMRGEKLDAQLAYWTRQLAPPLPVLDLPADRPRPARQGIRGSRHSRLLPRALAEELAELSRRESATLFMTLLAAFQALLHRASGHVDLLTGTPVDNRGRPETETLIGFFVNTLVLRARVARDQPFRGFLAQVRETVFEAHANQDLPLEKLVEALRPERSAGSQPLFQVAFELQGPALGGAALPGLRTELVELDTGTAKFDLTLFVRDLGGALRATLEIAEDLFEPATADRLLGHLEVLLAALAGRPETRVEELPLLTAEERGQILGVWAGTATPYPRESSIHGLFVEVAARSPEAVAVEMGEESLTYRQLEEGANRLAHHLRALGVARGTPVGVCLERSAALVEALLAVLKAGGAYVPLDPVHPGKRLAWILEDTGAPVLLTRAREAESFAGSHVAVVRLDADAGAIAARSAMPPEDGTGAEDLAYVIYTSGSTGAPKGVAVPHRAVVRLVRDTDYVRIRPDDRVAQAANASFDAATFEIWGPLLNGGRIVGIAKDVAIAPRELAAALRDGGVTTLFLTTALFNQVAREAPAAFSGLRTLLFGGEAVDPGAVREVLAAGPPERLLHVYGPTESTTFSSWHLVGEVAEAARTIPIGRPVANTRIVLLDAGLQAVPAGAPGELCLGGDGLAFGYLGRPDLTAEKLMPDPTTAEPGARLYRSGDLARWLPTGVVEFLGRFDHQVKVRGFRVEMGEIEAVLAAHPAVGEVVVVAREERGDRRLVAYLAPAGEGAVDVREVREALREQLPDYMIPSSFVVLPALPLNANGKVDRGALPEPAPDRPDATAAEARPRTPFEEVVAGIFSELLGVPEVGAQDDFFDLGGHSLLATRLVSRLRQDLGAASLSLRDAFERPTVAALAESVAAALRGPGAGIPPLEVVPRDAPQPLSFAQQRLWYLDRLAPGNLLYNVPTLVHLDGPLDLWALRGTLAGIVRRHAVLRTTFAQDGAEPVQVLGPAWEPDLALQDLSQLPAAERTAELRRLAEAEAREPFDLQRGPLLRARLLRLRAEEHALLFTLHHIVCDGWSIDVLLREVAALYRSLAAGLAPELPEPPFQYADYAVWQRRWLSGEGLEKPLVYWRRQLRDLVMPELPTDRPRPATPSHRGTHLSFRWPSGLAASLEALSRREHVSRFMTLLGAFQSLLHRWCGQDDISLGTPVAGRDRVEVESLIGFFVNTLVMRTRLSGDPSFQGLLARVRETALAAYAHQELPFDRLVEELSPERSGGHSPLFRVFFAVHEAPPEPEIPGLSLRLERIDRRTATMDLSLVLTRTQDGLEGFFEYSHDLFDDATVMRLEGHFRNLIEAVAERPSQRLSILPLLSAPERQQLLRESQAFQRTYPVANSLSRAFEAQVARRPEAIAAVFEGRRLTYGDLNRRANRIAHRLRGMGVGPEVPVGVFLERSLETLVAPLAILKAGGAYVPLDPAYPAERIAFVLKDTRTPVLLTDSSLAARLPAAGARTVYLDLEEELFAGAPEHDPEGQASPDQAAYVIYTSGSTGKPKGVVMSHRGALRLFAATDAWYGFGEQDVWALFFSYAFDFSVWEIFGALLSGGRLIVVPYWVSRAPSALLDLVREERVTVLNQTPSAFVQMIAAEVASGPPRELPLRLVMFGGEMLDFKSLEPWVDRHGDSAPRLVNMYGITETAVHSTYRPVRAEEVRGSSASFIGVPIPDLQIYILDRRMEPVPIGATGEIYVGGDGLARCYLNRPELTAERFVPDPFGDRPGARLYKSGDLARPTANGEVAYLGRLDYQIKIRGFRVELGEIESRLAEHPGVRHAVVIPWDRGHGDVRLIAYVAPDPLRGAEVRWRLHLEKEGAAAVEVRDLPSESLWETPDELVQDLRSFLREHLPEHMMPTYIVPLEDLPLTPNGKIDRRALPAVDLARPRADANRLPPRTPLEEGLAAIWRQALEVERFGVKDNFFELGGHSLVLTQVAWRVREAFGVELPLRALFDAPTIEGMARAIAARHVEMGEPAVVTRVLAEVRRLSPEEARSLLEVER